MPTAQTREKDGIRARIAAVSGADRVPVDFRVIYDTGDFFRVEYDDVIALDERYFWVKGYEKEGRFGLDDEPKYWVRRAIDLHDGSTKILKLVFHEAFETRIGTVAIRCFRSPGKEARILDLVNGHKNFMHGSWINDRAGNNVRILDYIHGKRFDHIVNVSGHDHEDYFYNYFPRLLDQFIELTDAIRFLHAHGEKHGDIRRDHILFDRERKVNRWIDFDYNYMHGESMFAFDLHGLGNILVFLVGRGDVLVPELYYTKRELYDSLFREDLNISYKNRVANLKKIYPYIPENLNRILLHFSYGAEVFYETTDQMLDDLGDARAVLSLATS